MDERNRGLAAPERAGARRRALIGWLAPPLMLAAVATGIFVVLRGGTGLLGVVLLGCLVTVIGWVLVSVLWPGRVDRTCPECGRSALERLDPERTVGLRCRACGWRDEAASAFVLAEEEGPLERAVLLERRERRRSARGAVRATAEVDSRRAGD